jgi:Protein of unknown function (DUF2442)
MRTFIRVQTVQPLEGWVMQVHFTNGTTRAIDLAPYLADGAIFAPIRSDPTYFQQAFVDGGTIAWPNGADIDPDVLYYDGLPPWAAHPASTVEAS